MCKLCALSLRYQQPSSGNSQLPNLKQFSSLIANKQPTPRPNKTSEKVKN
ncbi:MAG: hypothetical protein KME28_11410 [Pelatocladus maniniholoensis HA4357-MV3]|jgi:hypothetical protein|uniref:Uncharacterized protein n=1 Tax=Pelatocladus maniniholoensis HA4357-MV3 TaxID=1117104 RepID=A0A9E3LT83_9NOST|nr:hypothetical protein [Pelatocladus maniniholoensis HA4357-MV3]BAZ68429.1 hypothetical protein NIES4106_31910 [Fischerella sp. NIES-4106]